MPCKKCEAAAHPLVLVFYLDIEIMQNEERRTTIVESVNLVIEKKRMNAVAFFLPTTTAERIDCINPVILPEDEMQKVQAMIDDVNKHFGIGADLNDTEDITID